MTTPYSRLRSWTPEVNRGEPIQDTIDYLDHTIETREELERVVGHEYGYLGQASDKRR